VRIKVHLGVGLIVMATLMASAVSGATGVSSIVIKDATLTAAHKGAPSAISLKLTNTSDVTIWITSVSSPLSPSDMIDYDTNMTVKSSDMLVDSKIKVRAGHTISLGWHGQGAMLGSVAKSFRKGMKVPLTIAWHTTSNSVSQHLSFEAVVVKPSTTIYFGSSMSGMDMG
jgi:copper(I)-binding protein